MPISLFETIATLKMQRKVLLAIGTTTTRALETLPYLRAQLTPQQKNECSSLAQTFRNALTTDITPTLATRYVQHIRRINDTYLLASSIYIYPGYTFLLVDQLITNFHLPKSSLLMLVAAMM